MKLQELFEGISPVVYHYTTLSNALSIVNSNRFRLTSAAGTERERELGSTDKNYFLSTTRHRLGGYHLNVGAQGVLFELNGRALAHRYSGKSVDYWGHDWDPKNPQKREAEDRIYNTEPYIENANKYIRSVHILVEEDIQKDANIVRTLRRLAIALKQANIPYPYYFYTDRNDWRVQNKRRTTTIPKLSAGAEQFRMTFHRRGDMLPYKELFFKDDKSRLSKEAERIRYHALWYPRDFLTQLRVSLHNNKSKPEESGLADLLRLFRKHKLKTPQDSLESLQKKWKQD